MINCILSNFLQSVSICAFATKSYYYPSMTGSGIKRSTRPLFPLFWGLTSAPIHNICIEKENSPIICVVRYSQYFSGGGSKCWATLPLIQQGTTQRMWGQSQELWVGHRKSNTFCQDLWCIVEWAAGIYKVISRPTPCWAKKVLEGRVWFGE